MMKNVETLKRLGYSLALTEDGRVSVRGEARKEAEGALAGLRADRARAAACLRTWDAYSAGQRGFRVAFDFYTAHFPPGSPSDAAYWEETVEDLGGASEACGGDELSLDLLCAVYKALERASLALERASAEDEEEAP